MHIPPWTILSGFGSLTRRESSDLLAVFEDTTLLNVVVSRFKDLVDRVGEAELAEADGAFQRSVREASDQVFRSDRSEAMLRLQLWYATREALDLEPAIPLATRTANQHAASVAQRAADQLRETVGQEEERSSWTDIPGRVWFHVEGFFSSRGPSSAVACSPVAVSSSPLEPSWRRAWQFRWR